MGVKGFYLVNLAGSRWLIPCELWIDTQQNSSQWLVVDRPTDYSNLDQAIADSELCVLSFQSHSMVGVKIIVCLQGLLNCSAVTSFLNDSHCWLKDVFVTGIPFLETPPWICIKAIESYYSPSIQMTREQLLYQIIDFLRVQNKKFCQFFPNNYFRFLIH